MAASARLGVESAYLNNAGNNGLYSKIGHGFFHDDEILLDLIGGEKRNYIEEKLGEAERLQVQYGRWYQESRSNYSKQRSNEFIGDDIQEELENLGYLQ